jgi:hypothetical protein
MVSGGDPADDQYPDKPKRMRWTTYNRLLDKLRAADGVADERLNLMTQHAQIAERKYCRPHARPFRLRFARVVAVFPVCSPATF